MAFRLFGRSKKNSAPQEPPQPTSTTAEMEDDGFTLVNATPQPTTPSGMYPSLGVPSTSGQTVPNGYALNSTGVTSTSHYLDGVPFSLSSHCQLGGDQFSALTSKLDNINNRITNLNLNLNDMDYNFRIERSVIRDISTTDSFNRLSMS